MPRNDPEYLLNEQYADSSNLDARAALHQRFSTNKTGWNPWILAQIQPHLPTEGALLEVGCGPARAWREYAARIPAGWAITLTDFSPGMVAAARANLQDVDRAFTIQQANAQDLPFPDQAFDAVIANHMLYHVPDLDKALAEIRRVLKPGGWLCAATNGNAHMRGLTDLLHAFDSSSDPDTAMPTRSFRLENGMDALSAHFAHVELARYEDGLHVTEVEPLVAYAASMHYLGLDRNPERLAAFRAFVTQEMAARGGAIDIEKASGLFLAQRQP